METPRKKRCLKKVFIAEVEERGADGGGTRCPFHFGIRTYFRNPPEKELIETVDYLEESDFHYDIGEDKKSCKWEKGCIWCGVPLLFMGVLAVLIGQLTPPKEAVVGRRGPLAYLDRRAILFNHRLELCRLVGLAIVCAGALLILLSFLLAAYNIAPSHHYSPVFATSTAPSGIPLSGVLTTVQPPSTTVPPRR